MIRQERRSTPVPASLAVAAAVLTDYDRYRQWLPGVAASRLLVREGDVALVELEAPALSRRRLTLEVVRISASAIVFQQVGLYRRGGLAGRCALSGDGDRVELDASARLPGPWFDLRLRRRLSRALERAGGAFADRCRSVAAGGAESAPERRKVLEIVRRGEGLEVWLRGRTFRLPPAAGERSAR